MIIGDSTGRVHAGEVDVFAEPWPRVPGRYPVVYNHSAAADATELRGGSLPAVFAVTQYLVDIMKFSILCATMWPSLGAAGLPAGSSVGLASWRGRVEEEVAVHASTFGSSDPIGLYGVSMGTTNSLIYALEHPANVRWMVLFSPVALLVEYELANTGGNRALIDTAWNVSSGNMPSQSDIYTRIMAGGLGSIPVLWIESSDDGYSNGAFATKYSQIIAATGGFHQALGAVGHGNGTVAAADLAAMGAFIQAH